LHGCHPRLEVVRQGVPFCVWLVAARRVLHTSSTPYLPNRARGLLGHFPPHSRLRSFFLGVLKVSHYSGNRSLCSTTSSVIEESLSSDNNLGRLSLTPEAISLTTCAT
jgi:hypothetical protein